MNAIALVHRGDRTDFLRYLKVLDQLIVSSGQTNNICIYVANIPPAAVQQITSQDVQQFRTGIELVQGDSVSELTALQMCLQTIPPTIEAVLILSNYLPNPQYVSRISQFLKDNQVGIWGSSLQLDPIVWRLRLDSRCLLIRHTLIDQLNGLDVRYVHGEYSFIDLIYRTEKLGYQIHSFTEPIGQPIDIPHQYQINTSVKQYYHIRNACFFAALHESKYTQLHIYLKIVGMVLWKKQLKHESVRRGLIDGLQLLLNQNSKR